MSKPKTPEDELPAVTRWPMIVVGFLVWLGTGAIGLVEIFLARQTVVRIYGHYSNDVNVGTLVGNVTVVVSAVIWLAYVVMAGETAMRRLNKRESWTMFAWAFAIELLILILYFIV